MNIETQKQKYRAEIARCQKRREELSAELLKLNSARRDAIEADRMAVIAQVNAQTALKELEES